MQKISVSKKTGFFTYGSPVVIYDHRSKPFYMHPANGGKFFSFNLPKGEYFTECNCEPMREPIPYALPTLPKRQKNIPIPARLKQMRVKIGRNPNKASVIVGVHSVLVDPAIFALPLPNIIFVLFHEIGHYYFKSEEFCDLFAARQMLRLGYNPTQCSTAIIGTLSERAEGRKNCLVQKLFNTK